MISCYFEAHVRRKLLSGLCHCHETGFADGRTYKPWHGCLVPHCNQAESSADSACVELMWGRFVICPCRMHFGQITNLPHDLRRIAARLQRRASPLYFRPSQVGVSIGVHGCGVC